MRFHIFAVALMLGGCPTSTTPGVLTIDDALEANAAQSLVVGGGKGWRYFDGCNTSTCVGNSCTSTLVACPVDDSAFVDSLPPCRDGVPLRIGELCSFEVSP